MDHITEELKKLSVGHIKSILDVVVWRRGGDNFISGDTINEKQRGLSFTSTVSRIRNIVLTR